MRNGSIMRGRDRSVRISSGQKYAPKAHLQARKRPFLLHNGEDVPVFVNELILLPNGSHATQLRASSISCPRRSSSVPASRKIRESQNIIREEEEEDIRYEDDDTDPFYDKDKAISPIIDDLWSNNSHMEREVLTSRKPAKRKLSPLRHESGRLQFVRRLRSSQKRRGGGSSRRRCKSVPSRTVKPYVKYSMKDFEDAYRYGIQSRSYKLPPSPSPSPSPSPQVEKNSLPEIKKELLLLEPRNSSVKREKPKPKLRPWQKLNKKTAVEKKQKHVRRSISPDDKRSESRLVATDYIKEEIINPSVFPEKPPLLTRETTPSIERSSSPACIEPPRRESVAAEKPKEKECEIKFVFSQPCDETKTKTRTPPPQQQRQTPSSSPQQRQQQYVSPPSQNQHQYVSLNLQQEHNHQQHQYVPPPQQPGQQQKQQASGDFPYAFCYAYPVAPPAPQIPPPQPMFNQGGFQSFAPPPWAWAHPQYHSYPPPSSSYYPQPFYENFQTPSSFFQQQQQPQEQHQSPTTAEEFQSYNSATKMQQQQSQREFKQPSSKKLDSLSHTERAAAIIGDFLELFRGPPGPPGPMGPAGAKGSKGKTPKNISGNDAGNMSLSWAGQNRNCMETLVPAGTRVGVATMIYKGTSGNTVTRFPTIDLIIGASPMGSSDVNLVWRIYDIDRSRVIAESTDITHQELTRITLPVSMRELSVQSSTWEIQVLNKNTTVVKAKLGAMNTNLS